jgi:hypothetical protein
VNADKSPEKGLGYYNDYDAVVYTPNSELNTRAMVKITNKDFGYFNISALPNITNAWPSPEERLFKESLESIFSNSDEVLDWLFPWIIEVSGILGF